MRTRTKYIHEGRYAAAVEVQMVQSDDDWSPTLSLDDARKLDTVRELLRDGQIDTAAEIAQVFEMKPIPSPR